MWQKTEQMLQAWSDLALQEKKAGTECMLGKEEEAAMYSLKQDFWVHDCSSQFFLLLL